MNMHITLSTLESRLKQALQTIEKQDDAFDLLAHAKEFPYDPREMQPLENIIRAEISLYGQHKSKAGFPEGGYGHKYLLGHLERTSFAMYTSLRENDVSETDAQTLRASVFPHDLGKTLQDTSYWPYEIEKPVIPKHIKDKRPEHTDFIIPAISNAARGSGIDFSMDTHQGRLNFQHLVRICYVGKYHHENELGTGPHTLPATKIHPVMKEFIAIDTADGKLKANYNLKSGPVDQDGIISKIFGEMAHGKLSGHFHPDVLQKKEKLYRRNPNLLFGKP